MNAMPIYDQSKLTDFFDMDEYYPEGFAEVTEDTPINDQRVELLGQLHTACLYLFQPILENIEELPLQDQVIMRGKIYLCLGYIISDLMKIYNLYRNEVVALIWYIPIDLKLIEDDSEGAKINEVPKIDIPFFDLLWVSLVNLFKPARERMDELDSWKRGLLNEGIITSVNWLSTEIAKVYDLTREQIALLSTSVLRELQLDGIIGSNHVH